MARPAACRRRLRLDRAAQPGRRGRRGRRPALRAAPAGGRGRRPRPPAGQARGLRRHAVASSSRRRATSTREELVHIGEILVFVGPRFVVTVRHGKASPLHDVRLDLERQPELLAIGPERRPLRRRRPHRRRLRDGHRGGSRTTSSRSRSRGLLRRAGRTRPSASTASSASSLQFRRAVSPAGRADAAAGLAADGPADRPAHGRLLPRRPRPPAARRRPHRGLRRAADRRAAGQPRAAHDARQRRTCAASPPGWRSSPCPTMVFGALRHELRAHAGADVAPRLPRGPAGSRSPSAWSSTSACGARAGSEGERACRRGRRGMLADATRSGARLRDMVPS